MTYGEWLIKQTRERQAASLAHMKTSARLGEVQRTAPYSEEAVRLTAEVRAYYEQRGG